MTSARSPIIETLAVTVLTLPRLDVGCPDLLVTFAAITGVTREVLPQSAISMKMSESVSTENRIYL